MKSQLSNITMGKSSAAPLLGLVLAGGKSRRMGKDKSQILYGKEPHDVFTARLLEDRLGKAVISKSTNPPSPPSHFEYVTDRFPGTGPLGAIASVQMSYPGHALLVLACDLPLIDSQTIETLLRVRNKDGDATLLKAAEAEYPEPLVAIYEPSSQRAIKAQLDAGEYALFGLLSKCRVHIHELEERHHMPLFNANSPDDLEKAQILIRKHKIK